MNVSPTWASLAVVCFEQQFGYSIDTKSIDTESCSLAGAWDFETLDAPEVKNILEHRIIVISGFTNSKKFAKEYSSSGADLKTFTADASTAAESGMTRFGKYLERNEKDFAAYMAFPSSEQKLLPKLCHRPFSWEDFNDGQLSVMAISSD